MDIDIAKVAKLARLKLTDEEMAQMQQQLPAILEYVGKLQEVDTSGVDPKAYLTDATNVFREDVPVNDSAVRQAVVDAFPKSVAGALDVPAVFE